MKVAIIKPHSLTFSILMTSLVLLSSEVIVTTIFPFIGLQYFRITICTLIVLYLSFYQNNLLIAPLIIFFQYMHGFFSIDDWAISAASGLGVSMIISYLRGLIRLSTPFVTMIFVQVFQIVWFLFASFILYFKSQSLELILERFWGFIPESLLISLIAPAIFNLLDKFWIYEKNERFEGRS